VRADAGRGVSEEACFNQPEIYFKRNYSACPCSAGRNYSPPEPDFADNWLRWDALRWLRCHLPRRTCGLAGAGWI